MYDVVVVGAGAVGCAIARELSRYRLKICVAERAEDVCSGTSKANSGIVHAGFDARPGTKKAWLNVKGNAMMEALCRDLDVPFIRNGSLVLCPSDIQAKDGRPDPDGMNTLKHLLEQGRQNGVPGLKILDRKQLHETEPNLADTAAAALYAPTGGIVCPFTLTIALAENACANGAQIRLNEEVLDIAALPGGCFAVTTDREILKTRAVVNAAGVYADTIHNMVSAQPIRITPRRGQYCLFDHEAADCVRHTVFQLPTKMGKGVLVTPTAHGNLLIGPTAEEIRDKEDTATTRAGLEEVFAKAKETLADVPYRQVITSFAGLRAHSDTDDFIIGEICDVPGFFDAAGIESPGLTCAPAIGDLVASQVARKLNAELKPDFNGKRKGITQVHKLPLAERAALIRENPAYGNIICRCEMISEGEILDAIHAVPPARSLDAVKRRTRAGMGRCQSGFCMIRVMEILRREWQTDMSEVTKCGGASAVISEGGKNGNI